MQHKAGSRLRTAREVAASCLPPQLSERGAGARVRDEHEVPVLAVRRRRGLLREAEAVLEHLSLDRPREVEPAPHGAGGREQLVRSELEDHANGMMPAGPRGRRPETPPFWSYEIPARTGSSSRTTS